MSPRVRLPVPKRPSIKLEKQLSHRHGGSLVAGVDEAGRGPLAGPVVAAAVILPLDGRRPIGLNDSKKLTAKARERLFREIQRLAVSWGIGIATAQEIDTYNILGATHLACRRALDMLTPRAELLLTDCLEFPDETRPTMALIRGDAISSSIAAASILAKVTRDRLMTHYAREFPGYGWEENKGYPTKDHLEALTALGPTSLHRMTFNGVGFFSHEVQRSRTFEALAARYKACAAGAPHDQWAALQADVQTQAPALPPSDLAEIRRMMAHAPSHLTPRTTPMQRFQARIHVMLKRDVADVQGMAIEQSLSRHGEQVGAVKAGKYFEFEFEAENEPAARARAERLAHDVFSNPVIEYSTTEVGAL